MYLPYREVIESLIDGNYESEHGRDEAVTMAQTLWVVAIPSYQEKIEDCEFMIEFLAENPLPNEKVEVYENTKNITNNLITRLRESFPIKE